MYTFQYIYVYKSTLQMWEERNSRLYWNKMRKWNTVKQLKKKMEKEKRGRKWRCKKSHEKVSLDCEWWAMMYAYVCVAGWC